MEVRFKHSDFFLELSIIEDILSIIGQGLNKSQLIFQIFRSWHISHNVNIGQKSKQTQ